MKCLVQILVQSFDCLSVLLSLEIELTYLNLFRSAQTIPSDGLQKSDESHPHNFTKVESLPSNSLDLKHEKIPGNNQHFFSSTSAIALPNEFWK